MIWRDNWYRRDKRFTMFAMLLGHAVNLKKGKEGIVPILLL